MNKISGVFEVRKISNDIWEMGGQLWFRDPFEKNFMPLHRIKRIVAHEKSRFQDILILDTMKFGRTLVLDGFPQMSERSPIYREIIGGVSIILHPQPQPTSALILGGGDGEVWHVMRNCKSIKDAVLVDIDPDVPRLTRKHMPRVWKGASGDINQGRLKILTEDALTYLKKTQKKFDIIVLDLTDPTESSLSTPLMQPDFFADIVQHLEPYGIICMQSGQLTENDWQDHLRVRQLFEKEFKSSRIHSLTMHIPWFSTAWSAIIASDRWLLPMLHNQVAIENRFSTTYAGFASRLNYLNPETFQALFALSPDLKRKLKLA